MSAKGKNRYQKNLQDVTFYDVHKVMEDNFFDPNFNITKLTGRLNISYYRLNQIFEEVGHIKPYELLTYFRLFNAVKLLSTTNYSFKKVAKLSGFNDSRTLRRLFKEEISINPQIFKEATEKITTISEIIITSKTHYE